MPATPDAVSTVLGFDYGARRSGVENRIASSAAQVSQAFSFSSVSIYPGLQPA